MVFAVTAFFFLNDQAEVVHPGRNRGSFFLLPYQKPYTKMLGKNVFLTSHEKSAMHCYAAEKADIFAQNFRNPDTRVDNRLLKQQAEKSNKIKKFWAKLF